MSRTRRQRDAVAPSLFPFLAVLLCTMGSLVLILMLIVSGAQADAKQVAQDAKDRKEEVESLVALAVSSYERQLEDGRFDLEKKRLTLQHFEEHILELAGELEDLQRTSSLIQSSDETHETLLDEHQQKISELEKQLLEAKAKLKSKLEKPDGDKPVFAVIPYEGKSGTHRRPIYLECRADGIIIQPEGNRLTPEDLRPPYGPGNPLDAALRAIRAEYAPSNGAITRTAYPLLLVRPSGVLTYALARAAMSGWDDQFGYELIAEDLDLVFPDGKPGLSVKISQAIQLAQQRQAALVMAMPRKYQRRDSELDSLGTYSDTGLAAGPASSGHGTSAFSSGNLEEYGGGGGNAAQQAGMERSEGMQFADAANTGIGSSNHSAMGDPSLGSLGDQHRGGFSDFLGNGSTANPPSNAATIENGFLGGSGEPNPVNDPSAARGFSSLDPTSAPGSQAELTNQRGEEWEYSASGVTGSTSNATTRSSQNGPSEGEGSQSFAGDAAQALSPQQASRGAASRASSSMADGMNADPSNAQDSPRALSLDLSAGNSQSESTTPIAAQRGRNWAWSEGPPTHTAIVRALYLHCFTDRWVLLPESGNPERGTVIPFDGTPEQRAERLAKAVQQRVDAWGLALTGGYWKPVLVVDVTPQADWRYEQLRRLMQGSGLEIQRRQQTAGSIREVH